jgi:hypothetical protein
VSRIDELELFEIHAQNELKKRDLKINSLNEQVKIYESLTEKLSN